MTKTIHRYRITETTLEGTPLQKRCSVQMPKGAVCRHIAIQNGDITVWAEVNPDQEPEARCFVIAGTGEEIPETAEHSGTVKAEQYIWHVLEDRPPRKLERGR